MHFFWKLFEMYIADLQNLEIYLYNFICKLSLIKFPNKIYEK